MHLAEDHFLPEIIDPVTLETLPPGTTGELVLTTLTKEALPVLRYRTRDLTSIDPAPCACGRTLVRIARLTGRTDDMLIVRGVNVFPSQIEHALTQVGEVAPHYLLVLRREGALDSLEVQVEATADVAAGGAEVLARVGGRVRRRLHEVIGAHRRRHRAPAPHARAQRRQSTPRPGPARGRRWIMSEHESEHRDVVTLSEPDGHCQVCGAPHATDDPIVCAVCGEPVLRWGWAP